MRYYISEEYAQEERLLLAVCNVVNVLMKELLLEVLGKNL